MTNCQDSPLLLQSSLLFFALLHQFLQQLHPPHHCWRTPEFHWCPFSSSEEHPWCWETWLPPVALQKKGPWLYLICSIHSHKAFFISFSPSCKSQNQLKCNELTTDQVPWLTLFFLKHHVLDWKWNKYKRKKSTAQRDVTMFGTEGKHISEQRSDGTGTNHTCTTEMPQILFLEEVLQEWKTTKQTKLR